MLLLKVRDITLAIAIILIFSLVPSDTLSSKKDREYFIEIPIYLTASTFPLI